jgi:adenylate cyclase
MGGQYPFKPFLKARLFQPFILGLLIGILGIVATVVRFGTYLEENYGLELLFKLRGIRQAPSDVVIVGIDRESAELFNLPDDPRKWPRALHANLIENLSAVGPSVIAFDINFNENRSVKEDRVFAEAIKKSQNIVLCDCIKIDKVAVTAGGKTSHGEVDIANILKPIQPLTQSAVATAPFPLPKIPHKVSQIWTFKTITGETPTFPVVVFQIYGLQAYDEFRSLLRKINAENVDKLPQNKEEIIKTKSVERFIHDLRSIFKNEPSIAGRMLNEIQQQKKRSNQPSDIKNYQLITSLVKMYQTSMDSQYLNFYGPARTIATIPYYQIIKSREEDKNAYHFDLKGKAVFVGLSALSFTDQQDSYYTVFSQEKGIDISGVEIAATAFANLLEDKFITPLDFRLHIVIILLWGIVTGILCKRFSIAISALSVLVLGILYLSFSVYQFSTSGIWFPVIIPIVFQTTGALFIGVVWNYIDVKKERQNIRKAFGYYLPDSVVDQMAKNIENIHASQQIVYGICLATDAEQYSALAETMEPKELGTFMNKYFETIFRPIKRFDGIIADVIGDSVLAIWIASHPDKKLKEKACMAALDIANAIQKFNRDAAKYKLPTRIALHSGHILLGNIGAFDHYEYRPVGDIVNTATRIERLNKHLSTKLLVTREVVSQLEGFLTRELGEFKLAGKTKPVTIYELVSRIEESNEQQQKAYEIFAEGFHAYRMQSWDEAIEKFQVCNDLIGNDGPSIFYINLCKKEKELEHRELWDGIIHLRRK